MNNKIILNFKNIISELENKELKIVFLKNRGIFIEDKQNNMYQIDYHYSSYLDNLIEKGAIVEFNLVDDSYIMDWEKEIWEIPEVKAFIKRRHL